MPARGARRAGERLLAIGAQIGIGEQTIAQPQSEAIDQHRLLRRRRARRFGELLRRLDRPPIAVASLPMRGDAGAHLRVEGLRRGDIGPGAGLCCHEPLGEGALAGARAAEDEGQMRILAHSLSDVALFGMSRLAFSTLRRRGETLSRRLAPTKPAPGEDREQQRRQGDAGREPGCDARRKARRLGRGGEARQSGVIGRGERLAGMGARPEEIAPLDMERIEPRRKFRIAPIARAGDIGEERYISSAGERKDRRSASARWRASCAS